MQLLSKIWKESIVDNIKKVNELRMDGKYCDIILRSKDDMDIKAHRSMLYMGSGFFQNLFSSGMKDADANVIDLKHMKGSHIEKIVTFIYCGEIDLDINEDVEDIIQHATYLQIKDLVEDCTQLMGEHINDSNCLRYWRLANECFVENLENMCISYILTSSNHISKDENFLMNLTLEETKKLLIGQRKKLEEQKTDGKEDIQDEEEEDIEDEDEFKISKLIEPRFLPTKRIFTILRNSVKTLSGDGDVYAFQKEVHNSECFGYTTFNNYLLLCGGINSLDVVTNACRIFEPLNNEWKDFPALESERYFHECVFHDDKIYACGGGSQLNQAHKSVEIFDFGEEKWIPGPEMKSGLFNFGLASVEKSLYIMKNGVWRIDPRESNDWINIVVQNNNSGWNSYYTKCIPIGSDIFCFGSATSPLVFDVRTNNCRFEWINNNFTNYTGHFKVCELNGYIYVIQRNNDPIYFDLFKYNTDGKLMFEKYKILYTPNRSIEALVPLYYHSKLKKT